MGAKWKTSKEGFPDMQKTVEALDGKKVNVGVLQGEAQWLAAIHEYGCRIPVTDKMRRYLAARGLYLKKDTTEIVIPERSFLRSGYDQYRDDVLNKAEKLLPDVLGGNMSADQYCKAVGILLSDKIKDFAIDLREPANHPFTVDQKGSSNPLVDTGDMIGGITYEVEG